MNQNRRKVTYGIKEAAAGVWSGQPEQPFNTTVCRSSTTCSCKATRLYDPETGEVLDPADFTDKDGNPIVLESGHGGGLPEQSAEQRLSERSCT